MKKKIIISTDLEGPFGMHPFIKVKKDLYKYKLLDNAINFLIDYHYSNKIAITIAILGITALKSPLEVANLLNSIKLEYPKDSLIYKLNFDKNFFSLFLDNNNLFLKGKLLENTIIKENEYIKVACHSLSHLHILEDNVSESIIKFELEKSIEIIESLSLQDKRIDSYVSPRNQLNQDLCKTLLTKKINRIRSSCNIPLYSENHEMNTINRLKYKLLRKYDRFNLPFSKYIGRKSKGEKHIQSLELIDSGYFLEFPTSRLLLKRYHESFKRYLNYQIKRNQDISIWFHPHNMTDNLHLAKLYYKLSINTLNNLTNLDYEIVNI